MCIAGVKRYKCNYIKFDAEFLFPDICYPYNEKNEANNSMLSDEPGIDPSRIRAENRHCRTA